MKKQQKTKARIVIIMMLASAVMLLMPVVAMADWFIDNGDGTVLDIRTNLIWLKNANCYGVKWHKYLITILHRTWSLDREPTHTQICRLGQGTRSTWAERLLNAHA